MPTYYLRDGAGAVINGGATKKLLSLDEGPGVAAALSFGAAGRTWNIQIADGPTTVQSGNWILNAWCFKTGGTSNVRATAYIYTAGNSLVKTIGPSSNQSMTGTYTKYAFDMGFVASFDIADDDYIVIDIDESSGLGTPWIRFDDPVSATYDSNLVIPNFRIDASGSTTPTQCVHVIPGWCRPLTPIARVMEPPHQRLENGTTRAIGVAAFCGDPDYALGNKIQGVTFKITPDTGTYDGQDPYTFAEVTEMTANPDTGIWDYHVIVDESKFSANGPFTIEATVTGTAGGTRVLTLQWVVDTDGTLPQAEVWVDNTATDPGTVNDSGDPFETVHEAVKALEVAQGNVDGCIVYLEPGQDHVWDHLGDTTEIVNGVEWLTLKPKAGGSKSDTRLNATATYYASKVKLVRFYDLKIGTTGSSYMSEELTGNKLLVENCNVEGAGGTLGGLRPIGHGSTSRYLPDQIYYVDTTLQHIRDACMGQTSTQDGTATFAGEVTLVRGCTLDDIRRDATYLAMCVVDTTVNNVDRGVTDGYHGDLNQWPAFDDRGSGPENVLWYGVETTEMDCLLWNWGGSTDLFFRTSNCAFVNIRWKVEDTADENPAAGATGDWHHILLWHLSFQYTGTTKPTHSEVHLSMGCRKNITQPRDRTGSVVSFVGCAVPRLILNSDEFEWSDETPGTVKNMKYLIDHASAFKHNNAYYTLSAVGDEAFPGSDLTLGDPGWDSLGLVHGDLRRRVPTRCVPCDINWQPRLEPTAIGCFETPFTPVRRRLGY